MKTFTIALPDDLAQLVEEHIAAGRYASAAEYFADLLRWEQEEGEPPWVVAALLEGVDSLDRGEGVVVTPDYWASLRARVHKRLQNRAGEVA